MKIEHNAHLVHLVTSVTIQVLQTIKAIHALKAITAQMLRFLTQYNVLLVLTTICLHSPHLMLALFVPRDTTAH